MKDRQKHKNRRFKWVKLFMPEDTGPVWGCQFYKLRCEEKDGHLKFWVWIVISIGIALALGQL